MGYTCTGYCTGPALKNPFQNWLLPKSTSWEGSPIKRPSVKENTSPGEETIIVALLRYGRVAYILLRLCRYVSQVAPVDLDCGSLGVGHSPSPVTAIKPLISLSGLLSALKHESRAGLTPTVSTVIEAEMVGPGLAGLWDNILKIG